MRRLLMILLLLGSLFGGVRVRRRQRAASSKCCRCFSTSKVATRISPSLFDRDAYQAYLRQHTNEISAIRFDVLWSAAHADNAN